MPFENYVDKLASAGWKLEREPSRLELSDTVRERYPGLPPDIEEFLCNIRLLTNQSETAWFLTSADFNGLSESAFAWDEFERISLESAEDDPDSQSEIRQFWNSHIPVLLSVKAGYSYFALKVEGEGAGRVVHGFEPEFEDAAVESASFEEFLNLVVQAARRDLGDSAITAAV